MTEDDDIAIAIVCVASTGSSVVFGGNMHAYDIPLLITPTEGVELFD